MKRIPRWMALVAIFTAGLVAFSPAFAMDLMERVITTQTTLVRHEATEYQRKVAEAHARAFLNAQIRARAQEIATKRQAKPSATPGKKGVAKAKPLLEQEDMIAATKEIKKKLPRYVAVDTPPDPKREPGVKHDVMIWDTQSESLVGNNVYDVPTPPALGAKAKFDTYSAQYVGSGTVALQ